MTAYKTFVFYTKQYFHVKFHKLQFFIPVQACMALYTNKLVGSWCREEYNLEEKMGTKKNKYVNLRNEL